MGTCAFEENIKNKNKQQKKNQQKEKIRNVKTMNETSMRNTIDECFDRFDRNQDGFLDLYEVIELVKHSYVQEAKGKKNNGQLNENYRENARKLMSNMSLEDESRINRQ